MSTSPVVIAEDIGFGHTKYSVGRNARNRILVERFPSLAAKVQNHSDPAHFSVLSKHDTHRVPVGQDWFEVGKDIRQILPPNFVGDHLSEDYALSPQYAALVYGALNYAATSVHATHVDCLVLGQPMNTIEKMGPLLERKFQGQHFIANGRQITIDQCKVFPQPLGSYMSYLSAADHKSKMPCALVIDPGYGTVDWFVCEGMKAVLHKSDAVPLGVSAILSKVAKTIIKDKYPEMPEHVLVRAIDESLVSEQPLMLYGASSTTPLLWATAFKWRMMPPKRSATPSALATKST